ncbi:MAG: hypothetical protein JXQ79_07360 [Rhodobacteraceae bacterium]|nr:hypothetical protein [Paracoccaceae bacterium]
MPFGAGARSPVQARRVLRHENDGFESAVPEAGLDVIFLYDCRPPLALVELFQILLRSLCATGRRVDRAALTQAQICLDVDGIPLAFGPDRLPERRNGLFYRPDCGRKHGAARLGFLVYRHQASLRLRVGHGAPEGLLEQVARFIAQVQMPKAVVLRGPRLVLSMAEFLQHGPAHLENLRQGAALPRPVARYDRPAAPEGQACSPLRHAPRPVPTPSAFSGYDAAMQDHRRLQAALRGPETQAQSVLAPRMAALAVFALSGAVLVWG